MKCRECKKQFTVTSGSQFAGCRLGFAFRGEMLDCWPFLRSYADADADILAEMVNRAVPKTIPELLRQDICQEVSLEVIAGATLDHDLVRQCTKEVFRQNQLLLGSRWMVSLDAPIPGTGILRTETLVWNGRDPLTEALERDYAAMKGDDWDVIYEPPSPLTTSWERARPYAQPDPDAFVKTETDRRPNRRRESLAPVESGEVERLMREVQQR